MLVEHIRDSQRTPDVLLLWCRFLRACRLLDVYYEFVFSLLLIDRTCRIMHFFVHIETPSAIAAKPK